MILLHMIFMTRVFFSLYQHDMYEDKLFNTFCWCRFLLFCEIQAAMSSKFC